MHAERLTLGSAVAACGALATRASAALLAAWHQRDCHLGEYQVHQQDEALAERNEQYRRFAAWAARTFREVRVERLDLREFQASGDPLAPAAELPRPVRRLRMWAGVSVLLAALQHACARRGTTYVRCDPAWTTQTCPLCGSLERYNAAAEIEHTCAQCGSRWDQDDAAARNLLAQDPRA